MLLGNYHRQNIKNIHKNMAESALLLATIIEHASLDRLESSGRMAVVSTSKSNMRVSRYHGLAVRMLSTKHLVLYWISLVRTSPDSLFL